MKTVFVKNNLVQLLDDGNVAISPVDAPDHTARLAFALIERWGAVAAESDGEDSAGRAKLKLQAPDDLVRRAFDIAQSAVAEAKKRGLMINMESIVGMIDG